MTRLFETDHPYYATEGNYFDRGCHMSYSSWSQFMADQGEDDMDLNFVYRWDWRKFEPDDYDRIVMAELTEEGQARDVLQLFYIGQRKALARSVSVQVTEEDEPQVREWLKTRAEHMRLTWFPLLEEEA